MLCAVINAPICLKLKPDLYYLFFCNQWETQLLTNVALLQAYQNVSRSAEGLPWIWDGRQS